MASIGAEILFYLVHNFILHMLLMCSTSANFCVPLHPNCVSIVLRIFIPVCAKTLFHLKKIHSYWWLVPCTLNFVSFCKYNCSLRVKSVFHLCFTWTEKWFPCSHDLFLYVIFFVPLCPTLYSACSRVFFLADKNVVHVVQIDFFSSSHDLLCMRQILFHFEAK